MKYLNTVALAILIATSPQLSSAGKVYQKAMLESEAAKDLHTITSAIFAKETALIKNPALLKALGEIEISSPTYMHMSLEKPSLFGHVKDITFKTIKKGRNLITKANERVKKVVSKLKPHLADKPDGYLDNAILNTVKIHRNSLKGFKKFYDGLHHTYKTLRGYTFSATGVSAVTPDVEEPKTETTYIVMSINTAKLKPDVEKIMEKKSGELIPHITLAAIRHPEFSDVKEKTSFKSALNTFALNLGERIISSSLAKKLTFMDVVVEEGKGLKTYKGSDYVEPFRTWLAKNKHKEAYITTEVEKKVF